MKAKTKIVTLEGTSELSNKDLISLMASAIERHFGNYEFQLTQKPRVQVAQGPKKGKL